MQLLYGIKKPLTFGYVTLCCLITFAQEASFSQADIFPFQPQHVHGSTLVELPNGDILVAWFQGSGERQADDVAVMGARKEKVSGIWSAPFLMADVPDFPDTNPVLFLDPKQQLWLVWYTVLANQWETSLLKYRLSDDYLHPGPPVWKWQEVIHMKPGGKTEQGIPADDPFVVAVKAKFEEYGQMLEKTETYVQLSEEEKQLARFRFDQRVAQLNALAEGKDWMARGKGVDSLGNAVTKEMGYPRFRRLGWQTRNKPLFLANGRMILPLYSDGFDFSIMAITENGGQTWSFSEPLVGLGPVQPALLEKKDGTIVAFMRDNGPPPQRLMESHSTDGGFHWSAVKDSNIPNPGSAADAVRLRDGRWLLVHNDTEDGRHSLAVSVSDDEGKTWRLLRQIENEPGARSHYPAIIEGREGDVHIVYSFHRRDEQGKELKTIRYIRW